MPSTSKAKVLHRATIQFGPIAIPTKVYPLIDNKAGVSFVQLHKDCGSHVKQPMYCPTCDTNITWGETIKGYEVSKDEYVKFSAEEIKALGADGGSSIEVIEFVNVSDIDPIFFAKPYVVGPDKGGERAYALLRTAMLQSDRAALTHYRTRGKEYLAVLRATDAGILLHQLYYDAAVRDVAAVVEEADVEVPPAELAATQAFIDAFTSDTFNIADHPDTYTEAAKAKIEEKLSGGTIKAAPSVARSDNTVDFAAALLDAAKKGPKKSKTKASSKKVAKKKPAAKKLAAKKSAKKAAKAS